ncbi:MAG TPA: response regulator [Acetobacteraceae bacterium]|jgi:CheY-like chemotaxis protein|nr:response regulator [Acetobacteraceae bacterium]
MTTVRREELIQALPYARRYARALTGGQESGDRLVAESVKALLETKSPEPDVRMALYQTITQQSDATSTPASGEAGLSRKQRQLLLLTSLEEMPLSRAAVIVALPERDAEAGLAAAREHLRAAAATSVLIIEDEPIIAMDLEELVESCGHRVVGVAASEQEAVAIATRERPGLILADINLGAGGDGANAVARILRSHDVPVIFVTAYPERLLTGEALEPAFVITKPFEPLTLAIATYQAVTGGVTLG